MCCTWIGVACDLHTIASWPRPHTCWRQFTAHWGDCTNLELRLLSLLLFWDQQFGFEPFRSLSFQGRSDGGRAAESAGAEPVSTGVRCGQRLQKHCALWLLLHLGSLSCLSCAGCPPRWSSGKASTSRRQTWVRNPLSPVFLFVFFFLRSSHTETPVDTLPGACRYWVVAGTGWLCQHSWTALLAPMDSLVVTSAKLTVLNTSLNCPIHISV